MKSHPARASSTLMKPPAFLKNLPTPARLLYRPMLLISLVLHGVFLMLPVSFDSKKSVLSDKEETVKITKLPLGSKSTGQASRKSSRNPTPQPTPQQRQVNLPKTPQTRQDNTPRLTDARPVRQIPPKSTVNRPVRQTNPPPNQRINQPSVTSDVSQSKPQQNLRRVQDSERGLQDLNQESQDSEQGLQGLEQKLQSSEQGLQGLEQESQGLNQESQGTEQESTSAEKIINFFATFPRYPSAEKGSGGVLRSEFDQATYIFHTEDDLATVASKFERELLPTQYFARPKQVRSEADFRVYEVSNSTGSETNYLHLILKNGKTAIYLEAENYNLNQLIEAKIEERDDQMLGGYVLLGLEGVKPLYNLKNFEPATDFDQLDEKDKFKDKNFDFKTARKTTADSPVSEEKLISSLNEQLKLFNFEPLLKEGSYGKSVIYKVKQDTSEMYLVLAPAKDEQGRPITVILLSADKPS